MFMDTTQDVEPPQDGVVRWVASQSTNPALRALIREAERDRRTRPSTPVDEPTSWSYPLTSTTSFSTPGRHSSNSTDSPYPPSLSGSSSPTSSPSLGPRASEPSPSRHAQLSAVHRWPLASSTSSANQPPRLPARSRSSSHSLGPSRPSISKEKYTPRDDEPEAMKILELLEVTCSRVDENSKMKQQVVRAKGRQSIALRPIAPMQRTCKGPPPLGMRRVSQLQPSQYSSTQGSSRGTTVLRFKPPLLANAGGKTTKNGNGMKPPSTSSSRQSTSARGNTTKALVVEMPMAAPNDPDSSFDVSFGLDVDALEEAMKAYD